MQQGRKSMKKILIALIIGISLVGCRKHIYDTCYGRIDTDTIEVSLFDADGSCCYQIHEVNDSNYCEKVYYNPRKDKYFKGFPDNIGREIITEYNPYKR